MTIVAYGYGISPGSGFIPGPSTPPVTPNNQIVSRYVSVRIRQTIYKLKRLYGGSIFLYRQGTPSVDIDTGVTTWTGRSVITISRAIILPVKIDRTQTQTISMISADKQFVYGGSYDRGSRWFYIDPRDLPPGYVIEQDDWIVYKGLDGIARKYEIKTAKDSEFDTLWEILGTELIGVIPEQVHNLTGYSILDLEQSASGVK